MTVIAVLLATLLGDVSVNIAGGLLSGLVAMAAGFTLVSWPSVVRRMNRSMQATRAARMASAPAPSAGTWLAGLALAAAGSFAVFVSLSAFVVAP